MTNDSHIISNEFNKYFTNIGPELAKDLPIVGNPLNYVNICQNSIFVPYITENEVKNVISGLKNSSPGWDDIPPSILKINVDSYITPLTHLINKSISDGVFQILLNWLQLFQYSNLATNPLFPIIGQFRFYHFFQNFLKKLCTTT